MTLTYFAQRIVELEEACLTYQQQISDLAYACRVLVDDGGHGCPMCDSGTLRNPEKSHWDTCGYELARRALAGLEPQE